MLLALWLYKADFRRLAGEFMLNNLADVQKANVFVTETPKWLIT